MGACRRELAMSRRVPASSQMPPRGRDREAGKRGVGPSQSLLPMPPLPDNPQSSSRDELPSVYSAARWRGA